MSWNRNAPYIGPRRRVPVRRAPSFFDSPFFEEEIAPARTRRQSPEPEPVKRTRGEEGDAARQRPAEVKERGAEPAVEEQVPAPEPETERPIPQPEEPDWKTMALRLQAEMDNFRKRQTRRAEERVSAERERLLRGVLPVVDNLARALDHSNGGENGLRQGVELINRELLRFLESEGVTRIEAVGQPFDPNKHEAIGTRPAEADPDTVVDEVETGYMLGDKLLRPARVIVAAA